jgi:F420-dependent oxidoreductase-like protein
MKLGVMIEAQEGIGWDEWQRLVRLTEDLGYESLWRSDHFFSLFGSRTRDALETFVSLTYAAQNSRRIRFGPLVASMTFRHPAIVARMAAAIDQLSGGRLILGLGAGWNVAEHEAFGIPLLPPGPRLRALEEGVRVIKALLSEDGASVAGRRFEVRDAYVNPKPAQRPLPILIGGGGEQRTLEIVARHADEWNVGGQSHEVYANKLRVLEAHCDKAGRDPATIARSIMAGYVAGESDAEVQRQWDAAQERLPPERRRSLRDAQAAGALAGTPSQLVEQIEAWEAQGVSRIMLQNRQMPEDRTLELVAKEVLPKV